MTRKILCYLILPYLCFAGFDTLFAQANIDIEEISTFIEKSFGKSPVKGLAISIVSDDDVLLNQTLGAGLDGPLTPNTPLFLGSVSKTLTALAICRLSDQGRIFLTDPVSKYLGSDFFAGPSLADNITIKALLHHYSGFSQLSGYDRELEFEGIFDNIHPVDSVGSVGRYSSFNYAVLGKLIEKVSGKSYRDFMDEEVFKPLGMNSTYIPDPEEGKKLRGYCLAYGMPIETEQMSYGYFIIPAGYIVSTLHDLNKYCQMFLNEGKIIFSEDSATQYLEAETVKAMFTPYDGGEYGFGKSWGIGKINGVHVNSHEGMTKISNAYISLLPEKKLAIAIIANTNSGPFFSISSTLSRGIISIIDQKPVQDKVIWEYIIRILMGFLMLKTLYQLINKILSWKKHGFPLHIHRPHKIHTFILDSIPLLVLIFLPGVIHVSLDMLLRIMPDIGFAVLVSGIISSILLFFHLLLPKPAKQ